MKLILTLEQQDGRHTYRTTIIREHPEGDMAEMIQVFREVALAAGWHPDTVAEYMPHDDMTQPEE